MWATPPPVPPQVSMQALNTPSSLAPCPLLGYGDLLSSLLACAEPGLPISHSSTLYTLALYSWSSLRVPVLRQCPPDHSLPLRAVPSSGLICTTGPWVWPAEVPRYLKLSRSETTHFRVLQTAFESWVPSPSWGHHHPLQPQVSALPGMP